MQAGTGIRGGRTNGARYVLRGFSINKGATRGGTGSPLAVHRPGTAKLMPGLSPEPPDPKFKKLVPGGLRPKSDVAEKNFTWHGFCFTLLKDTFRIWLFFELVKCINGTSTIWGLEPNLP